MKMTVMYKQMNGDIQASFKLKNMVELISRKTCFEITLGKNNKLILEYKKTSYSKIANSIMRGKDIKKEVLLEIEYGINEICKELESLGIENIRILKMILIDIIPLAANEKFYMFYPLFNALNNYFIDNSIGDQTDYSYYACSGKDEVKKEEIYFQYENIKTLLFKNKITFSRPLKEYRSEKINNGMSIKVESVCKRDMNLSLKDFREMKWFFLYKENMIELILELLGKINYVIIYEANKIYSFLKKYINNISKLKNGKLEVEEDYSYEFNEEIEIQKEDNIPQKFNIDNFLLKYREYITNIESLKIVYFSLKNELSWSQSTMYNRLNKAIDRLTMVYKVDKEYLKIEKVCLYLLDLMLKNMSMYYSESSYETLERNKGIIFPEKF